MKFLLNVCILTVLIAGSFGYQDIIYNNDTLTLRLSDQSRSLTGAPGSRHSIEFILDNKGPRNRFIIRQDGELSGNINKQYVDLGSDEMVLITVDNIVLFSGQHQYQKYVLHVAADTNGPWNSGGGSDNQPWNNGGSGYNPGDSEWSEWSNGGRPNIHGRQRPDMSGAGNDGFNSGSGGSNGGYNDGSNGGYNNGGYNDGSNGGFNNGGYNDGSNGGYNGGSGERPDSNGGFNNGGYNDGSNGGYNNGGYNDGSNGGYNNGGYNDGSNGGFNGGSGERPDSNGGYNNGGSNNGGYNDGSNGGYHGAMRNFGDKVDYLRKGERNEIKTTVLFKVAAHDEPVDLKLPEIMTDELYSECDDDVACTMQTWTATWRVRDADSGLFRIKMKDTGDREPFWWHENFEVGTRGWVSVHGKVSCCAEGVGLEVEDIKTNNLIGYEEREDAEAWDINLIIGISVGVGVLLIIVVVIVVVFVVRKKYSPVSTTSS